MTTHRTPSEAAPAAQRYAGAPAVRSAWGERWRSFRWELRTIAGQHPQLSPLVVRRSGVPVGPETDVVIEGYPRCGNTFAVTAFLQAQPRPLNVAHHVHVPAQLLLAVRRDLPAIALIRVPEEAVLSFVVRLPHLSLRQALRSYLRFYEPLLPVRRRLVVASLKEVSSDFGAVIRRVNQLHGTSFGVFEPSEGNIQRVLESVDRSDRSAFGTGEAFERSRARPSPEREKMKDALRLEYGAATLSRVRGQAEDLYERFLGG
jgi:hypothetical protein